MEVTYVVTDIQPENNITTATVSTKFGSFSGKARCNPTDENNYMVGMTLATYRARVKAMKMTKRVLRERIRVLQEALERTEQLRTFKNIYGAGIRSVLHENLEELEKLKQSIEDYENAIEDITEKGYRSFCVAHFARDLISESEWDNAD